MTLIDVFASAASLLFNAPANVNASDTVIDLLLSATSDASRMMDASSAYDAMGNSFTRNHRYADWMAEQSGVGWPDDYKNWLNQSDHWPTTTEDFESIREAAEANDPFYRFYHATTGQGWAEYTAGVRGK